MKYSNKRREDPTIRAKVEQIVEDRKQALAWAAELLREAHEVLAPLARRYDDDAIFNRQAHDVAIASLSLSHDAKFKAGIGGETYIGNLAAGPLGERIERGMAQ